MIESEWEFRDAVIPDSCQEEKKMLVGDIILFKQGQRLTSLTNGIDFTLSYDSQFVITKIGTYQFLTGSMPYEVPEYYAEDYVTKDKKVRFYTCHNFLNYIRNPQIVGRHYFEGKYYWANYDGDCVVIECVKSGQKRNSRFLKTGRSAVFKCCEFQQIGDIIEK